MCLAAMLSVAMLIPLAFAYALKDEEKNAKYVIIGVLVVYLCLTVFSLGDIWRDVGFAERVFAFSDASLYQDTENDGCFVVKENIWNPFNPYDRIEIDQAYANDLVEKVVDAESQLDDLKNLKIISANE